MELINYKEIINKKCCSSEFIMMLLENHSESDVQIFLSVVYGGYTLLEVANITGQSSETIKEICKVFYEKYYKEKDCDSDYNKSVGFVDSGRHIYNPRMGSYKGY